MASERQPSGETSLRQQFTGSRGKLLSIIATVCGGLLVILGSLLPWEATTLPFGGKLTIDGIANGYGVVTLILGVITVLTGMNYILSSSVPRFATWLPIVTSLLAGSIAAYGYNRISRYQVVGITDDLSSIGIAATKVSDLISTSPGIGIWFILLGAVLAFLGGVLARNGLSSGLNISTSG
jgi:hypothetical protein